MGTNNTIFLEVIEWLDQTGKEIVHRIPENGSGEIKFGAQLTVRESQAAVFFYNGKAYDAFGAGRHTLQTANLPILTKILSIPWGMTSPLRAEVYFVNMRVFPNLKWGTKDPVAFKDSQLGLIRLRAFGVFNIKVVQPVLLINRLVGTQGVYTTEEISEYLNQVIISRFNDFLGENLDTIFNLPGKYDAVSEGLKQRLAEDLSHFGLALAGLYITSITPPQEVQKAIDDKSRLGMFDDLNKLMQMKAAMAMEKASEMQGEAGSGLGMGLGVMMPAMFSEALRGSQQQPQAQQTAACFECRRAIPCDAAFCPYCGHHQIVFQQCTQCGKNLTPKARFCPQCGKQTDEKPQPRKCRKCGTENLSNSTYCNQCGEKL
jgi:membrane protease subunit (stomatin/prohibitin family)